MLRAVIFFYSYENTYFWAKILILRCKNTENGKSNLAALLIKRTFHQILMLMALTIITPAMPGHHKERTRQTKEKSYRYPFTTPGLRETIVDKMLCLRAYALGGLEPPTLWIWGESTLHYTTVLPLLYISFNFSLFCFWRNYFIKVTQSYYIKTCLQFCPPPKKKPLPFAGSFKHDG